ncbi:MAG: hypothetical protein HFE04_02900 [Bacilli bacterium]|nr:hypothetical protein [Bacilli bacterium]
MKNREEIMEKNSMKLFIMICEYFLTLLILYISCKLLKVRHCLVFIQAISVSMPIILNFTKTKTSKKNSIIILLLYFFLILGLPFIFGKTYDLTVDGNSYHKTAIGFIKNGWNTIYEESEEFQKNNDDVVQFDEETRIGLWIDHYPKGTWVVAATMYEMTGNIESGKAINAILIIMLYIISYNIFQIIFKKPWKSMLIATLVILNPIVISQIFTYYVDGLMGMCFTIECLLLMLIKPNEKQNREIWISIFGICALFVNIKFTGLLYSGAIAAVYYFYWLIKYRKEKDYITYIKRITLYFTIIFGISIFYIGSDSYIKNTIDHHNPLYPLIGKEKVDIITTMQPKSFEDKNMLEKFTISLFSKTENVTYNAGEPRLKKPYKIYNEEKMILMLPDVRIGGFGPLSALIAIISIIMLIPSLYLFIKKEKKNLEYITLPLIAIIITTILVGENWWARYVPQLHLIPIMSIGLLLYTSKYYKKHLINKILLIMSIVVFGLNILCYKTSFIELVKSFKEINKDLIEMKYMENIELKLGGMESLYGYFYNLKDKGIKYTINNEITDEESRYIYSWKFKIKNK